MASKMSRGRDRTNALIDLKAAQQKKYTDPLRCEFCEALISFIKAFTRNVGEDIVPVEPHFRLIKFQAHSVSCRYNVHGQITIIARKSDKSIIAPIDGNRFELRLLAVQKAFKDLRSARAKQKTDTDQSSAIPQKKYIEKEGRLASYINSAMRVLQVRSMCEDNTEIENSLVLNFKGIRVTWSDFTLMTKIYFSAMNNYRLQLFRYQLLSVE